MKRLLTFFAIVILLGAQSLQAQWIQTNGPYGGVWRRPLSELVTGVGK